MNATLARVYASKSVLLAAAAGAVWYVAVRPLTHELQQARAAFDAFAVEIDDHARAFGSSPFAAKDVADDLAARKHALQAAFQDSSNPAQVYDRLGALASRSGVRLERVEPGKGGKGLVSQCPEIVVSAVHTVEAVGSMSQLADFFTAIDTDLGMSRVGAVRLNPVPGSSGEQLTATVETTHLRLQERAAKPGAATDSKSAPKSASKSNAKAPASSPTGAEPANPREKK
ncbi:MAG: hypothetical protein JNL50_03345 [Phycisphaerae bacterium]|nr:hypothetical protein [Phycisphaerae bacterium]